MEDLSECEHFEEYVPSGPYNRIDLGSMLDSGKFSSRNDEPRGRMAYSVKF